VDAKTGCLHWVFQGMTRPRRILPFEMFYISLVFGDLIGWVYSLDAKTGKRTLEAGVEDHEARA